MHKIDLEMRLLDEIAEARVLAIGDVMLDRYWVGKALRLSPEAPVPVVDLEKVLNIPGGAANVAANIAGLGAQVILAGVTGDDEAGAELRSLLRMKHISDEALIVNSDRKTTTKTRVLVHNQQIARIDDETAEPISAADEQILVSKVIDQIDMVDGVVVSDYAKGCLTSSVLSAVIKAAKDRGRPVVVDPKSRDLRKYNGATLLTPNLSEALHAAGLENAGEEHANEAAERILGEVEADSLLITLGEHGMKLFKRGEAEVHFPSMARQVFDVTGAGDTVVGVLTAALAAGGDIHSSITLANFAAGIAVEKVGTSIVGSEELRRAVRGDIHRFENAQ